MILSHHGELEFGSPKVPLFAEAMLLHYLDNLDSKMECARGAIEKDRSIEGVWTSYSAPLERSILKKAKFLDGEASPSAPALPDQAGSGPPQSVPAAQSSAGADSPQKHRADAPSPFASKLHDALSGPKQ